MTLFRQMSFQEIIVIEFLKLQQSKCFRSLSAMKKLQAGGTDPPNLRRKAILCPTPGFLIIESKKTKNQVSMILSILLCANSSSVDKSGSNQIFGRFK